MRLDPPPLIKVAMLAADTKIWNGQPSPLAEQAAAALEPSLTHRKGGRYVCIGKARMQSENWRECVYSDGQMRAGRRVDMREVYVYWSPEDGSMWVRSAEEMQDGRFTGVLPE